MEQYDVNTGKVLKFLAMRGCSQELIHRNKSCFQEFKKHLDTIGGTFSDTAVSEWLKQNHDVWPEYKVSCWGMAMSRLVSVYKIGSICPDRTGKNSSIYDFLDEALKAEADEYLEHAKSVGIAPTYTGTLRRRISHFLYYLQLRGLHSISEAGYPDILSFYAEDEHVSENSKDQCMNTIRAFLKFYACKGCCPIGFSLAISKFLNRQIITDSRFINKGCSEPENSSDFIRFDEVECFVNAIADAGYGETIQHSSGHVITEFYLFCDIHSLPFNEEIAWAWLEKVPNISEKSRNQWRRPLSQFILFRKTGRIETGATYSFHRRMDDLPFWCYDKLDEFLRLLQREGREDSTVTMYRSSVTRFCQYLCKAGITSFNLITADTLQDFNLQDKHLTPEGKSAYNCRIRNFLKYLAEEGDIANPFLYKALSSDSAPRLRIVSVLSDEDVDCICTVNTSSLTPVEMRDYAILRTGLALGLRISDIVKLKFDDIDWKVRTIRIVQKKTGVVLRLPLPVNIANLIFLYIRDSRPKSSSSYIFIRHTMPYGGLNRIVGRNALDRFLPDRKTKGHNFHTVRKNFATSLLRSGTKLPLIAESLGHRTEDTVKKYLSLDTEQMRRCPLSLKDAGIPMDGGVADE